MTQVKRSVGRYELLEELGRGGMGIVYLARQTDLGRLVAVKELGAFHAPDRAAAQRFVLEARLASSLSHPNVVTVHDFFEYAGRPYIAMEYLPRGSLRRYMRSLTLAQAAAVFEGLLAGLAHAEAEGIVHRDLKPENLLMSKEGKVKIADFGIAKVSGELRSASVTTASGTTLGTPAYMAPEQAIGERIGPWTDLYAIGVIAYELFSGRVPFAGKDLEVMIRHLHTPVPPVTSVNGGVPESISSWIGRLLEKDPERRTGSAAVAWEELEEIVIDILGPRWRRQGRLVDAGGDDGGAVAGSSPATPPPLDLPPGPMTPTEVDVPVVAGAPGEHDAHGAHEAPPQPRPQRSRRGTGLRPSGRVALAATALVAVLGVAAASLLRDGDGPPSRAAPGVTLAVAGASVSLPAGWERTGEVAAGDRLELAPAAAAAPAGRPADGTITLGLGPPSAANPALLSAAFAQRLTASPAESRQIVRDLPRGLQAYRYGGLLTHGASAALTVYAVPTSAGIVTVACGAPATATTCEAVARTLTVRGATPFAVGPDARYAVRVDRSLRTLDAALRRPRASLVRQTTAKAQATAAAQTAAALRASRASLAKLEAGPADRGGHGALLGALRRAAGAYSALARAARAVDGAAYARAARRARAAQGAIAAARGRLVAGGYRGLITARYRVRTVPALKAPPPPTAQPSATAPSATTPAPVATPPPPPAKLEPVLVP